MLARTTQLAPHAASLPAAAGRRRLAPRQDVLSRGRRAQEGGPGRPHPPRHLPNRVHRGGGQGTGGRAGQVRWRPPSGSSCAAASSPLDGRSRPAALPACRKLAAEYSGKQPHVIGVSRGPGMHRQGTARAPQPPRRAAAALPLLASPRALHYSTPGRSLPPSPPADPERRLYVHGRPRALDGADAGGAHARLCARQLLRQRHHLLGLRQAHVRHGGGRRGAAHPPGGERGGRRRGGRAGTGASPHHQPSASPLGAPLHPHTRIKQNKTHERRDPPPPEPPSHGS